MGINRFEDMEAWKIVRALNRKVYCLSKKGSFCLDFVLRDQVRLSTTSNVSNRTEGFDSQSNPTFIRFPAAAQGTAAEVD